MADSTRTKLQVANAVLRSVGERDVTTLSNTLGNMVDDSLRTALIEVSTTNKWRELLTRMVADSWSSDEASITTVNFFAIDNVYWYSNPAAAAPTDFDYHSIPIQQVTLQEYETFTIAHYDDNAGRPYRWCLKDEKTFLVNPYPADAVLGQDHIFFSIYTIPDLPTSLTGTWGLSDHLLLLVEKRASGLLALRHPGDMALANQLNNEYALLRKQLVNSSKSAPKGAYTMFKRRRGMRGYRW